MVFEVVSVSVPKKTGLGLGQEVLETTVRQCAGSFFSRAKARETTTAPAPVMEGVMFLMECIAPWLAPVRFYHSTSLC